MNVLVLSFLLAKDDDPLLESRRQEGRKEGMPDNFNYQITPLDVIQSLANTILLSKFYKVYYLLMAVVSIICLFIVTNILSPYSISYHSHYYHSHTFQQ